LEFAVATPARSYSFSAFQHFACVFPFMLVDCASVWQNELRISDQPAINMKKTIIHLATVAVLTFPCSALSQGTAFTYQGRLNIGASPASGIYDLRFAVFDAASGGAQQGSSVTNSAVNVSNALFTVVLDFGNQFPGTNRWLDIGVRTNGGTTFTPLSPRQQFTPTPYAIMAANAALAANATLASSVSGTNVIGIIADGHLSANVALRAGGNTFNLNQVITGGSLYFDNAQLILGKNSSGTYENVFYPRWSDNITYLNYGSGGFNIRNNSNVSTMFMQNDGKIGLGVTPGFPLNFPSLLGDKISLYGTSGSHYGFGVQGSLLQIFADLASSDIAFGYGQSTGMTENVRFEGTGNVGIGTSTPAKLLQIGGVGTNKDGMIRLSSASTFGPNRTWDIGVPFDQVNTGGKYYSFVIADTNRAIPDFLIRWDTGFVGFGKTNPATRLDVAGEITSTAINLVSDRNEKEGFTAVDARSVLDKVAHLPISEWRYKSQTDARHIGPVAQDFYDAFGLGRDDKHITSVDADGVALAAIKGLNEKLEQQAREKDQRITDLEKQMGELKEMLSRLTAEKAAVAR
jgi:hypothetical protein